MDIIPLEILYYHIFPLLKDREFSALFLVFYKKLKVNNKMFHILKEKLKFYNALKHSVSTKINHEKDIVKFFGKIKSSYVPKIHPKYMQESFPKIFPSELKILEKNKISKSVIEKNVGDDCLPLLKSTILNGHPMIIGAIDLSFRKDIITRIPIGCDWIVNITFDEPVDLKLYRSLGYYFIGGGQLLCHKINTKRLKFGKYGVSPFHFFDIEINKDTKAKLKTFTIIDIHHKNDLIKMMEKDSEEFIKNYIQ